MALDTGMCVSMSVRIFFSVARALKSSSYYEVVVGIFFCREISCSFSIFLDSRPYRQWVSKFSCIGYNSND